MNSALLKGLTIVFPRDAVVLPELHVAPRGLSPPVAFRLWADKALYFTQCSDFL
ncbi:hypothetical protein M404DRAFT_991608 [Pisolithus tinctorius Marx 270]|uniref:Uncharacterized protein n=1 Tax=Pisolithus tinctorius Marx 270 TaxID=870435 RepID=A0A0C3PZJ9_PISTI|nr:hypothetical protein M404DRAFT_991608 [Pisolithus tinctorius Marx 270]